MTDPNIDSNFEATCRSLTAGLNPRSIAVVGASENPASAGSRTLRYLRRAGYGGQVFPINPKRSEIGGWPAVARLEDLDVVPDLVEIVVNSQQVVPAVEACVKMGVPLISIESAGFAEIGPAGAALQRELADLTRGSTTRIIGPNCLGQMVPGVGLFSTITAVIEEAWPPAGRVAVLAQSGGIGSSILAGLVSAGVGISHWVTTGNELDIDVGDVANYYATVPHLDTVLVYLEEVRNSQKVREGLRRLRAAGKSVYVLNGGTSSEGSKAAASHTGAMGTDSRLLSAMLTALDVRQVSSIRQLIDIAVLSQCGVAPTRDIAVVSASGGHGVIAADAAIAHGLSLPRFGEDVENRLRELIPLCSAANPLDTTGTAALKLELLSGALRTVGSAESVGAIVLMLGHLGFVPSYTANLFPLLASVAESMDCPIIAITLRPEGTASIPGSNIAIIEEPEDAMAALNVMAPERTVSDSPPEVPAEPEDPASRLAAAAAKADSLAEWESLDLLAKAGLQVVETHYVTEAAGIDAAVSTLGDENVVKLMVPNVTHKTERGWVRTRLDESAAAATIRSFVAEATSSELTGWRVSIQPQVPDVTAELLLGMVKDEKFGWKLLLGAGGQLAELLDDVQCLETPASEQDIRAALGRLRVWKLLAGWRGKPGGAVDAVVTAVEQLQALALGSATATAIEVNPLVVTPKEAVAVDGVVVLGAAADD